MYDFENEKCTYCGADLFAWFNIRGKTVYEVGEDYFCTKGCAKKYFEFLITAYKKKCIRTDTEENS